MSRRVQKRVATNGDGNGLDTTPFADLDNLKKEIALKGEPPPPKATASPSVPAKRKAKHESKSKGRVEVRREKAGRGGKTVTTLRNFPSHVPLRSLETMAFDLKKQCACGGTLKGRVIELQGDVCQKVCELLDERGYQAVRAGG